MIQSTVPPNLELTVITASVIGGVSILGGTGTVIGSTLAAILFACIGSALIFLNVSAYWLRAVLGLLILATVLADMARRRRSDMMTAAQAAPPRDDPRASSLVHRALSCWPSLSDKFFTADNLLNQGRLMAEVGLVALAMTFVIVTGGIDLSVGSILGLTAILLGVFWQNLGLPLPLAMAAGHRRRHLRRLGQRPHHHPLQRAAADRHAGDAGALSRPCRRHQPGALGARLSGMVLLLRPGRSAGRSVPALDPRHLPRSSPRSSSGYTPFGRATYAIGANEMAARFSGIRVDRDEAVDLYRRRASSPALPP